MDQGRKGAEVFGSFQGGEAGFVELLEAADELVVGGILDMEDGEEGEEVNGGILLGCPSSYPRPPSSSFQMLCFGNEEGSQNGILQISSVTANDSSSSTSSSSSNSNVYKPKKTEGRRAAPSRGRTVASIGANTTIATTTSTKKPRKEQAPASQGGGAALKVRKEKLGERITALQQLVSPFGKSDTASVLHEALGYIRFLHEQVQVLSSPYLQSLPSSSHLHGVEEADESRSDLRSRGLCLVPISCTVHVADSNGADFWSPAMGNTNSPAIPKH